MTTVTTTPPDSLEMTDRGINGESQPNIKVGLPREGELRNKIAATILSCGLGGFYIPWGAPSGVYHLRCCRVDATNEWMIICFGLTCGVGCCCCRWCSWADSVHSYLEVDYYPSSRGKYVEAVTARWMRRKRRTSYIAKWRRKTPSLARIAFARREVDTLIKPNAPSGLYSSHDDDAEVGWKDKVMVLFEPATLLARLQCLSPFLFTSLAVAGLEEVQSLPSGGAVGLVHSDGYVSFPRPSFIVTNCPVVEAMYYKQLRGTTTQAHLSVSRDVVRYSYRQT